MTYRGRHRRRSAVSLLAPPIVLVAATGATLSASAAQPRFPIHPLVKAADMSAAPVAPSVLEPLEGPPPIDKVVFQNSHPKPPVASAPLVNLPAHLDFSAASIPRRVLAAYVNATQVADRRDAGCHLNGRPSPASGSSSPTTPAPGVRRPNTGTASPTRRSTARS